MVVIIRVITAFFSEMIITPLYFCSKKKIIGYVQYNILHNNAQPNNKNIFHKSNHFVIEFGTDHAAYMV